MELRKIVSEEGAVLREFYGFCGISRIMMALWRQ
jgi:hypothetical protein